MKGAPTLLSAFTGAGGLDLGFEAAGFRVIGCIEHDVIAHSTLAVNRPNWLRLEPRDINLCAAALAPHDLGLQRGELSAIIAAPPCQPFSKAAQLSSTGRVGVVDKRATTVCSLIELVRSFLPEVLVIENVTGFVTGPSAAAPMVVSALRAIDDEYGTSYQTAVWKILDAANFGVPQHRRRVFYVATRSGYQLTWPVETHAARPLTSWDAIGEIRPVHTPKATGKWADLLPSIPAGSNYLWHTKAGGGTPLFGYRTRFWSFLLKLSPSQPSWTLPASPGPSTGPFHWLNRPLAVEEAARLQSFPSHWRFAGSLRQQLRQIGNATPPLLAEHIARAIGSQLFRIKYGPPPEYSLCFSAQPPVRAGHRARVPRKYLRLSRDYPDHPGTGNGPRPHKRIAESNEQGDGR